MFNPYCLVYVVTVMTITSCWLKCYGITSSGLVDHSLAQNAIDTIVVALPSFLVYLCSILVLL